MVLNELGQKISAALAKVANAEVVDDALLDLCLKDISTALLQADVNVKQVQLHFPVFLRAEIRLAGIVVVSVQPLKRQHER
jgi:signal recognition particle GTPase